MSRFLSQNQVELVRAKQNQQVFDEQIELATMTLLAAKETLIANGVNPDAVYATMPNPYNGGGQTPQAGVTRIDQSVAARALEGQLGVAPPRPLVEGGYRSQDAENTDDELEASFDMFRVNLED
jgi:hypothetical protein